MTTWDECTAAEQAHSDYSDFYKDIHGIRPRWMGVEQFEDEAHVAELFAKLKIESELVAREKKLREIANIDKLEARIANLITIGAKDRETAIRWIDDAEGSNGDYEYLCYMLDIPYGYFKVKA